MKVKIYHCITLCLMSIVLLQACKKNDIAQPDPEKPYTPGITIATSVKGRITDDKNKPVSGAMVYAGSSSTVTDINGRFSITGAQMVQNAALVKVVKAGFFTGYNKPLSIILI
jgi:hypothetical protein